MHWRVAYTAHLDIVYIDCATARVHKGRRT